MTGAGCGGSSELADCEMNCRQAQSLGSVDPKLESRNATGEPQTAFQQGPTDKSGALTTGSKSADAMPQRNTLEPMMQVQKRLIQGRGGPSYGPREWC